MGIIKLLALGFFILIYCMACRPSHPVEYSRITVAVDCTRSYSLDSLSLNGFEFSPLPENDIIWVYTNKGLHQLNLVSGAWMQAHLVFLLLNPERIILLETLFHALLY